MTLFLLFSLWTQSSYAMKPAPFTPVQYTTEDASLFLNSHPETNKTQLSNAQGEILWIMNEYIGRRKIFLSPDGNTLVLFGNLYFGHLLTQNEDAAVLYVYEKGLLQQTYTFSAFFGFSIAEARKRFDIPIMSGGWIPFLRYVTIDEIDWKKRIFFLTFQDKEKRESSF